VTALAACGGDRSPSAPTSPAPGPPPAPPPPATWTVSGSVRAADGDTPIAGARVEVVEGSGAGTAVQADEDGGYRIGGLQAGSYGLRASADGFDAQTRSVSVARDERVDFALVRPAPPGPPPPPTRLFLGTLVEGLSDRAIAGASVEADGLDPATTDANGAFRIETPEPERVRTVTLQSAEIVPRTTYLRMPGPDAALTAIPGGFDLAAFDQMFRGTGRLERWVTAPHLAIQTSVLEFTSVTAHTYVATDASLTDPEAEGLRADLVWGLPLLTDGRLAFASERLERADPGASVTVARAGEIVVARFAGLEAATGFWGYGRWASDGAGRIQSGIIMIDAGFDTSGSQFQRSLRVHELGHALGYNHVTTRESVMNASARLVPNEFDLQGARLAFLRPPGNRSPDVDPDEFTSNLGTGVLIWHGDR